MILFPLTYLSMSSYLVAENRIWQEHLAGDDWPSSACALLVVATCGRISRQSKMAMTTLNRIKPITSFSSLIATWRHSKEPNFDEPLGPSDSRGSSGEANGQNVTMNDHELVRGERPSYIASVRLGWHS